jgi:hypothetical protein
MRIGDAQLAIFAMAASSRSAAEKYGKRGCVLVRMFDKVFPDPEIRLALCQNNT